MKYAISFNQEVTALSGGVPLVKTSTELRTSLSEASQLACELPKWTLSFPPLAPKTVIIIAVPGLARIHAANPVIEFYFLEQAEKRARIGV